MVTALWFTPGNEAPGQEERGRGAADLTTVLVAAMPWPLGPSPVCDLLGRQEMTGLKQGLQPTCSPTCDRTVLRNQRPGRLRGGEEVAAGGLRTWERGQDGEVGVHQEPHWSTPHRSQIGERTQFPRGLSTDAAVSPVC